MDLELNGRAAAQQGREGWDQLLSAQPHTCISNTWHAWRNATCLGVPRRVKARTAGA